MNVTSHWMESWTKSVESNFFAFNLPFNFLFNYVEKFDSMHWALFEMASVFWKKHAWQRAWSTASTRRARAWPGSDQRKEDILSTTNLSTHRRRRLMSDRSRYGQDLAGRPHTTQLPHVASPAGHAWTLPFSQDKELGINCSPPRLVLLLKHLLLCSEKTCVNHWMLPFIW